MSMLIRKGTLVRKPNRKSSVRRTKSTGSSSSGSHSRPLDDVDRLSATSSVPPSPVAKSQHLYADISSDKSPAKHSVATTTSTIVSFDDSGLSYKTSVNRSLSCEAVSQGTSLQIEEANSEAENVCEFLCTASNIICSSTFMTSVVGLSTLVPVTMIAFGVKYLEECPLESKIPVYLIVGGCFAVLKIAATIGRSIQDRRQGNADIFSMSTGSDKGFHSKTYRTMDTILSLFLLSWHILGTVWILRIWKPRFKPLLHRPDMWCERSLYFFSVAVVVGVYAVLALVLLGLLCLVCVYRTSGSRRVTG